VLTISRNESIVLMGFIEAIKKATGKKASKNHILIHAGDVSAIFAGIGSL